MKDQPHILSYQYQMPLPPKGIFPVEPDKNSFPSPSRLRMMRNPLPDTKENREKGRIYYNYYCVFCHGESGQGNGPVGNSYMPKPADLHASKILKMTDGELFRAMLTGTGHDPVLLRIIPSQHRWYLVLYARELGHKQVLNEQANPPHRQDFKERALR
jgi:hypothetical protein